MPRGTGRDLTWTVVRAHDEEPDHQARRSPLTLVPYLLGRVGLFVVLVHP